jgi:RNA-directed DNA polymerase
VPHERGKSDPAIVAAKPTNKAGRPAAEPVERRACPWLEQGAGAEGNADQQSTLRTPSRASVSPGLERVRRAAKRNKEERFTALLHHVDADLLRQAYFWLKPEAAPRSGWGDVEGVRAGA